MYRVQWFEGGRYRVQFVGVYLGAWVSGFEMKHVEWGRYYWQHLLEGLGEQRYTVQEGDTA